MKHQQSKLLQNIFKAAIFLGVSAISAQSFATGTCGIGYITILDGGAIGGPMYMDVHIDGTGFKAPSNIPRLIRNNKRFSRIKWGNNEKWLNVVSNLRMAHVARMPVRLMTDDYDCNAADGWFEVMVCTNEEDCNY